MADQNRGSRGGPSGPGLKPGQDRRHSEAAEYGYTGPERRHYQQGSYGQRDTIPTLRPGNVRDMGLEGLHSDADVGGMGSDVKPEEPGGYGQSIGPDVPGDVDEDWDIDD